MAKKFIILDGEIRISPNVETHRELVKDGTEVQGGGEWFCNPEQKKCYLYGKSIDYGQAKKEDIEKALKDCFLSQVHQ